VEAIVKGTVRASQTAKKRPDRPLVVAGGASAGSSKTGNPLQDRSKGHPGKTSHHSLKTRGFRSEVGLGSGSDPPNAGKALGASSLYRGERGAPGLNRRSIADASSRRENLGRGTLQESSSSSLRSRLWRVRCLLRALARGRAWRGFL